MKLRAADLFCGAGGTSQGAEQSGAATVVCAVNHWDVAVKTHSANFPHTKHINSRLDQVNPGECENLDIIFASPECTDHSRARGGRPTNDQRRCGAWDLMRWIEYHRPSRIIVENVPEFREWGPVGDDGKPLKRFRGRFFSAWAEAIRSAGYRVDDRLLNAADYGAATSRTRLFVVARKGSRPVNWPDPTHAKMSGGELPGMEMRPWRAAAEIVDWSIPCRSVFLRSKPLADNTLDRIEAGIRKFVGPFVVLLRNNSTATSIADPLTTITAGGRHHGLAVPFQFKAIGNSAGLTRSIDQPLRTIIAARESEGIVIPFIKPNFNEREGQRPRSHDVGAPLPTITPRGAGDLILPYIIDVNHGEKGRSRGGRVHSIDQPLKTITAAKRGQALCIPFVVSYYSNGKAHSVAKPLGTITTRDRCGLAMAVVELAESIKPRNAAERKLVATMREYGVADVCFRMFLNPELALAQGFRQEYIFSGNKGEVTRQIGNSVPPDVAEALTLAAAA